MRLFLSIPLMDELREQIASDRERIKTTCFTREQLQRMRWIDPVQYHVTQYFIGNVEKEKVKFLLDCAREITSATKAFELQTERYEFKPRQNPRLLWLRFKPNASFTDLAQKFHNALVAEGFTNNEFPLEPIAHVTMIRLKQIKPYNPVLPVIPDLKLVVAFIHLMESELSQDGSKYGVIETIPLL